MLSNPVCQALAGLSEDRVAMGYGKLPWVDPPSKPMAQGIMISIQTSRELKEHDALDTLSILSMAGTPKSEMVDGDIP